MERMTDRLRELVWHILCEGIDNPGLVPYLTFMEVWTKEEIDFCIEWMKNKLGV